MAGTWRRRRRRWGGAGRRAALAIGCGTAGLRQQQQQNSGCGARGAALSSLVFVLRLRATRLHACGWRFSPPVLFGVRDALGGAVRAPLHARTLHVASVTAVGGWMSATTWMRSGALPWVPKARNITSRIRALGEGIPYGIGRTSGQDSPRSRSRVDCFHHHRRSKVLLARLAAGSHKARALSAGPRKRRGARAASGSQPRWRRARPSRTRSSCSRSARVSWRPRWRRCVWPWLSHELAARSKAPRTCSSQKCTNAHMQLACGPCGTALRIMHAGRRRPRAAPLSCTLLPAAARATGGAQRHRAADREDGRDALHAQGVQVSGRWLRATLRCAAVGRNSPGI